MKHFFAVLTFLFCSIVVFAQPSKGSIMLGGNVGFNSYFNSGLNNTIAFVSPSAIFFVGDQFGVGGKINLVTYLSENSDFNYTSLGVSPLARYYVNNSGDARLFGQAEVGLQVAALDDADPEAVFGAAFGVDFFLNPHVAIEGALGFQHYSVLESSSNRGVLLFNFGVVALIGGGSKE